MPFTEFVFKTNPTCNMQTTYDEEGNIVGGCDYCYEYEGGNLLWQLQPPRMSMEVVRAGAQRIGQHAARHALTAVRVAMHGGEPLLHSAAYIDEFSTAIRDMIAVLSPGTRVHLGVETNGTALDEEKLAVLARHDYQVGVSIDGGKNEQDRHRRSRTGGSTYERVVHGINLLRQSGIRWGIVSVIDTDNDPTTVLEALAAHQPGSISLLLPHANHSVPPKPGALSYGEWQKRAFDWYCAQPAERLIPMPIFDSHMRTLLGAETLQDAIGERVTQELFVLANGDWQRLDILKITEPGAVATNMNVFEHSLDYVALCDPGIRARRLGRAGLAPECLDCPLLKPCGGGYYPHRFKSGDERLRSSDPVSAFADAFKHPTVYCPDQKELLPYIAGEMEEQLSLPEGRLLHLLNTGST